MASSDSLPSNEDIVDEAAASSSSSLVKDASPETARQCSVSVDKCGILPISSPKEHGSPPLPKLQASPSRSRSPLASLEMRKRFLSPSKGYDELLSPTLEEPPKKKTIHLSPSRQSIESGSLTKYLPKFSPRDVLKFSPRRQGFKNLDEKKGKRRSVIQAGVYGQQRIASIKRKQAEGFNLLTEVVQSPSAQHNGAFEFEESDVKVTGQPEKSLKRRCSLVQAQPYAQSRIRSAKEKEKKGMHLSAILQSPSAKANGAALSPNNDDAADRDF